MIINGEENITGLVLKNKPYKENDMLLWQIGINSERGKEVKK